MIGFIIAYLLCVALFIVGVLLFENTEASIVLMLAGAFGIIVTTVISFDCSVDPDERLPVHPLVERTPYRLIISLPEDHYRMEHTYTDAYTVARPGPLHAVLVVPHNLWGIELTSQRHLELLP